MDGTVYDRAVLTLILAVDSTALWLNWQGYRRKRRASMKRRFNRILQSVGLR